MEVRYCLLKCLSGITQKLKKEEWREDIVLARVRSGAEADLYSCAFCLAVSFLTGD